MRSPASGFLLDHHVGSPTLLHVTLAEQALSRYASAQSIGDYPFTLGVGSAIRRRRAWSSGRGSRRRASEILAG